MGKHWVQARVTLTRYTDGGAFKTFRPGDWFEVRNQELLQLQAQGKIASALEVLGATFDFSECGVWWRGNSVFRYTDLDKYGIEQRHGAHCNKLPWRYTLIARASTALTAMNVALGFLRVEATGEWDGWEMAALLASGLPLANARGTEKEQARTLALLGDLRIPLYDTSKLWVRRTEATATLISAWDAELQSGADEQHAFARALYTSRVKLCTLPPDWIGGAPHIL